MENMIMEMPKKSKKPSIEALDMPSKKSDMDMASELEGEADGESGDDAVKPEANVELEKFSDEELQAEMQRRGLSASMSMPSIEIEPAGEEESEDSESKEKYEY
jgi:hypothetical protein